MTLVELMAVIAIISILAGLLIGGVSKAHARAKDRIWRIEAYHFVDYIRDHLAKFYQTQTNYPAYTAAELYQRNVFDDRIMDFLKCPHVQFIPFSSADREDKYILTMDGYWINGEKPVPGQYSGPILQKKHVTHPSG